MARPEFYNGGYYHIYNRGVDKRDIFLDDKDRIRFLKSIREFNVLKPIGSLFEKDKKERKRLLKKSDFKIPKNRISGKLVKLVCYCLNNNHYHFLIEQVVSDGISKFMHRLGLGYTKYFNNKYKRTGSLFGGTFKAVEIKNNRHLVWVSTYVNANAEIHKISKAENYDWCSLPDYLQRRKGTLCNREIIMNQFNNNITDYKKFVRMVIKEVSVKKDMKKYLLENF